MKLMIDITEGMYNKLKDIQFGSISSKVLFNKVKDGVPYKERLQGECVEEIIEELESRKDYGTEYAQAMEDVIAILTAKLNADKATENE